MVRLTEEELNVLSRTILGVQREGGIPVCEKRLFLSSLSSAHFEPEQIVKFTRFVSGEVWREVDAELDRAAHQRVTVLNIFDSRFPQKLRAAEGHPLVLFSKGREMQNGVVCVGIVGSRRASRYGEECSRTLASEITSLGAVVVSGLALGIDAAAHRGAIAASGQGKNLSSGVAVYGSGVLNIYPREHRELNEKLLESGGTVFSEYGVESPPLKHHFPERNRIVATLADLVIVVEAGEKSGSLITARLAAEAGREVFAVPGPVTSKMSIGTNGLLRDGATPIVSIDTFLKEFQERYHSRLTIKSAKKDVATHGPRRSNPHPAEPSDPFLKKVLNFVHQRERCHFDEIIDSIQAPPPETIAAIQQLEIFGNLTILPGSICTTSQFVME